MRQCHGPVSHFGIKSSFVFTNKTENIISEKPNIGNQAF